MNWIVGDAYYDYLYGYASYPDIYYSPSDGEIYWYYYDYNNGWTYTDNVYVTYVSYTMKKDFPKGPEDKQVKPVNGRPSLEDKPTKK